MNTDKLEILSLVRAYDLSIYELASRLGIPLKVTEGYILDLLKTGMLGLHTTNKGVKREYNTLGLSLTDHQLKVLQYLDEGIDKPELPVSSMILFLHIVDILKAYEFIDEDKCITDKGREVLDTLCEV